MTLPTLIAELEEALKAATPEPWYHVQAFESVPAVRTIHGKVPGQRVDYVSTWPGPGTPKGHRVVIPMETVAEGHIVRTVSSEDMALIALMRNSLPTLIESLKRQREALAEIARHDNTGITGPGRQQADSCVQIARAALKETTDV